MNCAQIAVTKQLAFKNRQDICSVFFAKKTVTDLFNREKFLLHSLH